ncbi:MAG: hypothetical protein WAM14_26635 [Candidatus Nitrosopolaris sp.]
MITEEEHFENNLTPKLINDYKSAKAEGRTNDDFDMERVRKYQQGGFGTRDWEDRELRDKLSYLVGRGLIEISDGRYHLTDFGKLWQKAPS